MQSQGANEYLLKRTFVSTSKKELKYDYGQSERQYERVEPIDIGHDLISLTVLVKFCRAPEQRALLRAAPMLTISLTVRPGPVRERDVSVTPPVVIGRGHHLGIEGGGSRHPLRPVRLDGHPSLLHLHDRLGLRVRRRNRGAAGRGPPISNGIPKTPKCRLVRVEAWPGPSNGVRKERKDPALRSS
jgi:hypothetical protein